MPLSGWETVDREDPVYKACVVATTATGAIAGGLTGSWLGPAGTLGGYLAGAAWGFAAGYFACPYLAPPIKRKFELGMDLTDTEVRDSAEAMGQFAGVTEARDAVHLVALSRLHASRKGDAPACYAPQLVARQILGG